MGVINLTLQSHINDEFKVQQSRSGTFCVGTVQDLQSNCGQLTVLLQFPARYNS